jgi:YYY domain-containing protein
MMETASGQNLPDTTPKGAEKPTPPKRVSILATVALIGILVIGAYFRFVGLNWDGDLHLHPDERFLTMVTSSIQSVGSLGDYFDTEKSTLNPNNVGYGYYVYGTLPLFMVRYVAEWVDRTGFSQVQIVGRALSGAFDLMTVVLIFLIALRLYRKSGLALLAAAFSAGAVLQIQLSHFYTVDNIANFFVYLAIYFAVIILTDRSLLRKVQESREDPIHPPVEAARISTVTEAKNENDPAEASEDGSEPNDDLAWLWHHWQGLDAFILFGLAAGMALASKISTAPMVFLLPIAAGIAVLRAPADDRNRYVVLLVRNMVIAALCCLLAFRIFQPYAFNGPSFFNFSISSNWTETLGELSQQSSGKVDFPPALQWANRPLSFSWQNMVVWGLGLPLGILAWVGFGWMGLRILFSLLKKTKTHQNGNRGWPEWQTHILMWIWTLVYFAWQSTAFSRTMRYQLQVYPALALMAAWAISELWGRRERLEQAIRTKGFGLRRAAAVILAVLVLGGTFAWAFAFTRIYTRPTTAEQASKWIYQNVPAAINLQVSSGNDSTYNQPIAFRNGLAISSQNPWSLVFRPKAAGTLTSLELEHVLDAVRGTEMKTLMVTVSDATNSQLPLDLALISDEFGGKDDASGDAYTILFPLAIQLDPAKTYLLQIAPSGDSTSLNLSGSVGLKINTTAGSVDQVLPDPVPALHDGEEFSTIFQSVQTGSMSSIYFPMVVDYGQSPDPKSIQVTIANPTADDGKPLASVQVTGSFEPGDDPRGKGYVAKFDPPVPLESGKVYVLKLKLSGSGAIALYGSVRARESSWDDSLPFSLNGYGAFDPTGLYPNELNFEMYWDDNAEKLDRFQSILDRADTIFINTNRQWGTTTRVTERYPLTIAYYRNLLGCPQTEDLIRCYAVAKPGMFSGELGFDLVEVVQSEPTLGPIEINTQFAEEAFTVYDHPKVLIFKKNANYDSAKVHQLLSSVDLRRVVHNSLTQVGKQKNLMLPADQLAVQRAGGTWSDLFNRNALFNRFPWMAAVFWYVVVTLLGWAVYPFVRLALRGLPDKGYPFARLVGMMTLAYMVWLAGSLNVAFTRTTITVCAVLLVLVNVALLYIQRNEIREELRTKKRYFITVEIIILAFFLLFLAIRLGNPDLWHPAKGGEKPMDFSFLNAVIKSTTFPPYDPWYAGGYINYYYYGFVVVGVLIKWLGIIPSIAYNLFLPTLFSLLAIGAFSIIWNLMSRNACDRLADPGSNIDSPQDLSDDGENGEKSNAPLYGGLAGAVGLLILGNLGTLRMVWQGIMRLNPSVDIDKANFFLQKIPWTITGLLRLAGGQGLAYSSGDWYWIPSRAIPGEPITEFPFFTFLYADPHAHLYALPMTVLALGWALSIVKGRWQWGIERSRYKWLHFAASFGLAGMVIGALRPTNTWDLPTYLAIGGVVVLYTAVRYARTPVTARLELPNWVMPLGIGLVSTAVLVGLAFGMYAPFAKWYGQAYNSIDLWSGAHTPFWSYMTHWGLFLFVIFTWLVWETIDWMANTPLSHAQKLVPYRPWFITAAVALALAIAGLTFMGVEVAWVALILAIWAAVLIFRPGQPDEKRLVLFMVGTGLTLTLAVELIVLVGDIGRMNTVFKFYLQAWTLLSLSAAAGLVWLVPAVDRVWRPNWRVGWQVALSVLVFCAALYPVTAATGKIQDRMSPEAPHTLDGMAYMQYSHYGENNHDLDLSEDYAAIQWMQDNVKGSPVIVEANLSEYRWGTRYTIYTGLPGVVGWSWHERQQRALNDSTQVTDRIDQVNNFYNTSVRSDVVNFLKTYDVKYIVVGQLEEATYDAMGIAKFDLWNGDLWDQVYHQGSTTIYQVRQ